MRSTATSDKSPNPIRQSSRLRSRLQSPMVRINRFMRPRGLMSNFPRDPHYLSSERGDRLPAQSPSSMPMLRALRVGVALSPSRHGDDAACADIGEGIVIRHGVCSFRSWYSAASESIWTACSSSHHIPDLHPMSRAHGAIRGSKTRRRSLHLKIDTGMNRPASSRQPAVTCRSASAARPCG